MLTRNQIQFVNSLKLKKHRDRHKLFVAEGVKIVTELVHSKIKVNQIYYLKDYRSKLIPSETIEYIEVTQNELERISSVVTPNEVLAVCEIPICNFEPDVFKNKLTLVLDDMQDPGNLGTIIRIADWFGIRNIICSKETADAYNSKVVQSTMGSISRVNVYYQDLVSCFESELVYLDLPVYGALLNGENIYTKKLISKGFIIIGNESRGISENLYQFITDKISIPSFSTHVDTGEAESLNAAVATAIICSEFRRRK